MLCYLVNITNADGKITFQFFDGRSDKVDYRTPSEGGVKLQYIKVQKQREWVIGGRGAGAI